MNIQNDVSNNTVSLPVIAKSASDWVGFTVQVIKENRIIWAIAALFLVGLGIIAYVKSKQFPSKAIFKLQGEIKASIEQLAPITSRDVTDSKQIIKVMNDSQKVWLEAYRVLNDLKPQYLSKWNDHTDAFYDKCSIDGSIESNTYILRGFEVKTKDLQNARLYCMPYLEQAIRKS